MVRTIWGWRIFLVVLLAISFIADAQEADDPDIERAKQIAAEVVEAVVAEQGAEADETEILLKIIEALRQEFGNEHLLTLRFMGATGFKLWERGRYPEAREFYEQLLGIHRRILGPEHPDTLTSLNNLAAILHAQGDISGARQREEQVLEIRRRVLGPDHPNTLATLGNLADTLRSQGDFDGARAREEEVLEARRRILGHEHPDTLKALANLAETLKAQGDFDGARTREEEVLEARRRILGNEHPDTLKALANLAGTLKAQGDFDGARTRYEEVLEASRRILGHEHPDTLTTLANLAGTLKAQGDFDGARTRYEEVLEASRRILGHEHPDTLKALANLAGTLRAQGDFDGARTREEEVLEASRRILGHEHPYTLKALANLAGTLKAQGDLDGARTREEEVLEARRRILGHEHPDTLGTIHNLAVTLLRMGRLEEAQGLLEQIAETREDADTFFFLGSTYRDAGMLQEASESFLKGLDALELQTAKTDVSEEIKVRFRAKYSNAYRDALALALAQDQPEEAFQILERYRAQSLLVLLRWGRQSPEIELPREEQNDFLLVARDYDDVTRRLERLGPNGDPDTARALRDRQLFLQRRLEVLRGEKLRAIGGQRLSPLSSEEFRQHLDPGTVVLGYNAAADSTDLFVMAKEAPLEVHRLPVSEFELWLQSARFFPLLFPTSESSESTSLEEAQETAESDARVQLGRWLYDKLLAPAGERLASAKRLLILPDGPLHYLPFSTLVRPTPDDERGWQYLVEWKPIHVAQSAAVYAELQGRRRNPAPEGESTSRTLVALGDPSYPPPPDSASVEPDEKPEGTARLPLAIRSAKDRGLFDLTRLPNTHREVKEIGRLFTEAKAEARTYLSTDATEERAKAELAVARYIHLAAHGLADPDVPADSFIALTIPEGLPEGRDNGILQGWEIMDTLRLDADLVVLSACVTAVGPNRAGEGLMSLSRAFLIAGARTVAASLWPVADDSTAELMIRFYRHLLAGQPKDEALRAAQMELIAGPIEYTNADGETVTGDFTAPYHWAAFQLIGDWR